MELCAIMLKTEVHMGVHHVPRERNIWSDDLANLNTAGWDPAKRWHPMAELEHTIVMEDLLFFGRQVGLHLPKKEQKEHRQRLLLTPASLTRPFQGRPSAASTDRPTKKPKFRQGHPSSTE